MKKLFIVAMVFGAAFASCQGSKSVKSFSTIDSLSYAFGVNASEYLNVRALADSTLVGDIFAAAVRDVMAGKAQMTSEEANNFLNEWFTVRKPAMDKIEGQAWLDEVKAGNSNIQTTESGLMYEIVNPGDASVKATNDADQVVANYRGTLKDGTQFDKNDSITFALNGVIKGWTEGLKLIGKGGEITLWIPSDLGYGERASGPIPPNSPLKFEVKLLDVIPAPAAE